MRRADGSSEGELVLDVESNLDDGTWSSDGEWIVAQGDELAITTDPFSFRPAP